MSRIHRALATVALALTLVGGTAAVAAAESDQLAQRRALYESELEQNLANAHPVAEDQNDRLLRSIETAQAERTQAAVEQVRAGERNLGPAPVVTVAPQPVPAADANVDPLIVLLLGLVGGLVGGAAIAAGAAANRRHGRRAVAA